MAGEGLDLSRRDFLKLGGKFLQASALAVGASAIEPFFNSSEHAGETIAYDEVINHDYLSSIERSWDRLRTVSKRYQETQGTQDPEKILDAKKLLILMIFTEAASRLGSKISEYPFSSTLLSHYLNGKGETVDVSSELLNQIKKYDGGLVGDYLSNAMLQLKSQKITTHSSKRNDYSLSDFRQLRNQLTHEQGVFTQYYDENDSDLFYALGEHGVRITADSASWRPTDTWDRGGSQISKYDFTIENPSVSIKDHYKFRLDTDINLPHLLILFLRGISPADLDATAQNIVSSINKTKLIPENIKNQLIDTIYSISSFSWARESVELVVGDIVLKEKDMALLETEFGARPFDVEGTAKYAGEVTSAFTVQ